MIFFINISRSFSSCKHNFDTHNYTQRKNLSISEVQRIFNRRSMVFWRISVEKNKCINVINKMLDSL